MDKYMLAFLIIVLGLIGLVIVLVACGGSYSVSYMIDEQGAPHVYLYSSRKKTLHLRTAEELGLPCDRLLGWSVFEDGPFIQDGNAYLFEPGDTVNAFHSDTILYPVWDSWCKDNVIIFRAKDKS